MKPVDCQPLYENAEYYDFQHRNFAADLPMYRALANRHAGPILELACGTGRIAVDLAKRGHAVSGLDISETMLEQAHKNARAAGCRVHFHHGDVRIFDLEETFRLILFPFNSISHLHDRRSLEAMFSSVRRHMTPDSRFVVSMFIPNPEYLIRDPGKRYPVGRFVHPRDGEITITESNTYDPIRQINRITWFYRSAGSVDEVRIQNNMRMFYPCEFQSLLYYNGFRIETVYGDYEMHPQTESSPMQIYVARIS